MNPFLRAILAAAAISTAITVAVTQAHAELVISEPSQSFSSALQNTSAKSQGYHTQFTNSQLPSETSIIKLMQVMHIDEQITAIINGQQAAIDVITTQTNNANKQSAGDKLNKRQRELQIKLQQILGQYGEMITGGIDEATDMETMTQAYIAAAKTYYTQAEIDAQIAFYDTPIGQSILDKQPQVTAAFLQHSLPKDMDIEETKEQLNELIPQMRQIIKDML